MNFPDFIGNKDVKAAISIAFDTGRFPHAILLQGEAGTGKRKLANIIARSLVCRVKDSAPCGDCPSCIRSAAGSHPDIRQVQGSGKTGAISVDTVKEITADAYKLPEEADCSVYLLFIDGRMSEPVQNKLLKLIEEPPEHAVFIFTCVSSEQLLATIRSRVQIYSLHPPDKNEAADYIVSAGLADADTAKKLAELCGGNIGEMLSELDGGEAALAHQTAAEMAVALMASSPHLLLKSAVPMTKSRSFAEAVFIRLGTIFRDACVRRNGGRAMLSPAKAEVERLCRLPVKRLMSLAELPEKYRAMLLGNANMSLLVTSFCAELRDDK